MSGALRVSEADGGNLITTWLRRDEVDLQIPKKPENHHADRFAMSDHVRYDRPLSGRVRFCDLVCGVIE